MEVLKHTFHRQCSQGTKCHSCLYICRLSRFQGLCSREFQFWFYNRHSNWKLKIHSSLRFWLLLDDKKYFQILSPDVQYHLNEEFLIRLKCLLLFSRQSLHQCPAWWKNNSSRALRIASSLSFSMHITRKLTSRSPSSQYSMSIHKELFPGE